MNIYDLISRAQKLRQETKLDSVSPDRVGALCEDTLKYINEFQLLASSPSLHKIYASVSAMQADKSPKSDLTGKALKPGQLVVIVPANQSDATAGDVYRYDGPSGNTSAWTFVSKIGAVPADAELNATSANPVQNKVVTEKLTELESEIGIITDYVLEIGAYYPDDNTYNDNIKTRLRFKRGTSIFLRKNSIIRLRDYSKAQLRVSWSNSNDSWENGKFSAFIQEDYICTEDAYYRISILPIPEVTQTNVDTLGSLLEICGYNSTAALDVQTTIINESCSITPPYRLEIGTYYPDTNKYDNSVKTRVRLQTGSSIRLEKGSIIRLKDYSGAKLRVTYLVDNVWSQQYSAWLQEDYICPMTADYRLCVVSVPEVTQTNVDTLGSLLEIYPYGSNQYLSYKLMQDKIYPVLLKNVPCCDNRTWKYYPIFEAVADCTIQITFKNTLDTFIRSQYSTGQWTTFAIQHRKANGESVVLTERVAQNGLSPHTKSLSVEMKKGDSLVYGDRLVGSYEYISVQYLNIVGVVAALDNVNEALSEIHLSKDIHSDKSKLIDASNYLAKRVTLAHFSDLHNGEAMLDKVLEYCETYKNYINDILFTGDYCNYYEDSLVWWSSREKAKKILGVIGNHEIQSFYTEGSQLTKTDIIGLKAYQKFIQPFISNWGTLGKTSVENGVLVYSASNPSGCNIYQPSNADAVGFSFYFKDYIGLRLIVLDWTNYNASQKAWLQATLNDALGKGLSVVVSAHFPSAEVIKSGNKFDALNPSDIAYDASWLNVFVEYDAHKDIQNFIDAGGDFVCWLCGHMHRDNFGHIKGFPAQTCVMVDSAQINPQETDILHAGDTSFNLVSIDVELGYFYLLRLGANKDMHGRVRDTLAYDYRKRCNISR